MLCIKQQTPGKPVYVVAHSAGSAVTLACAESAAARYAGTHRVAGPGSLRRLRSAAGPDLQRQGIDVFCSDRDRFYLGFGVRLLGTADGKRTDAAGRTGFCNPAPTAADAALYLKLHQHPWDPSVAWTGNNGEHNGTFKEAFMRTQVVPLLWPGA